MEKPQAYLNFLTQTVRITSATETTFEFPKIDRLYNKRILWAKLAHVDQVSVSPPATNGGVGNIVNGTAFDKGYVVLKYDDCDVVDTVPFYEFNPPKNNGMLFYLGLGLGPGSINNGISMVTNPGRCLDLSQCKVLFGNTTGLVANEICLFTFAYWNDR